MRTALFALLFCSCVTSRYVEYDPSYRPKESSDEVPLVTANELPGHAKLLGYIQVFHTNVTPRERIVSKALTEARLSGCTWLVHLNPRGNADVKTEGYEIVIGGPLSGLGPPQAEGENRADFACVGR